jgi:hypothetical protein
MISKNIPPIFLCKEIIEWWNKDVSLLAKVSQIREDLNSNFKPNLVQEFSRIRLYDALVLPIILYGSEIWTLIENDLKKDGYQSRRNFSEEQSVTPFLTRERMKNIHCSSKFSSNNAICILYFSVF